MNEAIGADIPEFDRWAVQHVCVHCLRHQRQAVVVWVSAGIAPCAWCGRRAEPTDTHGYVLAVVLRAETALERYAIANRADHRWAAFLDWWRR